MAQYDELIGLLIREGKHGGVWFASKLLDAAAAITDLQAQVAVLEKTSDDLHTALWKAEAQVAELSRPNVVTVTAYDCGFQAGVAQERAKVVEAERAALERTAGAVLDHRYGDSLLDSCGLRKEHRRDIADRLRSLIGDGNGTT